INGCFLNLTLFIFFPSRGTSSQMTDLIERLQKNADQVQNNIVDVEEKLQLDVQKIKTKKPLEHEEGTAKMLASSDKLLNILEEDAQKTLNHPQTEMIKEDIKQLKLRVEKLHTEHDKVYNLSAVDSGPTVNWSKIIEEKQAELNSKNFGSDLPLVNQQVEEHSIFHSEVKAIAPHVSKDGDKDYVSRLDLKYNKLLTGSQQHQENLNSLHDYMQRCTNELFWMDQQRNDRLNYDWSDRNLDYPNRSRQYENFITKNLETKESVINNLHDDGRKLLAANHPGKNAIEAHMEAVNADWKEYLNLLICEENHLKNMNDYHQFHKDAKDVQGLLKKVDTDLNQKYNPEFKDKYMIESLLRDLDDQDKALDRMDETVTSLKKRSQQVTPLKFRRETPLKPVPVTGLCEYDSDEGQVARGERYSLQKNLGVNWEVTDSSGQKQVAPAVCFMIPPTDPDAIALADNVSNQYKGVKAKTAANKKLLQKRYEELKNDNTAVPDTQEQQCRQLMSDLDKVSSDVDKQKKAVLTNLRPPLDPLQPVQDSRNKLQDLKNVTNAVSRIEPEKNKKVQEAEVFLTNNPKCASAPQLHTKVNETKNKFDRLDQLLNLSKDKIEAAHRLESSLQKGKDALTNYENKLALESTVPSSPLSVEQKQWDLSSLSSDLKSAKPLINESEQNLRNSKKCCDMLTQDLQEHCPDIERQETEVRKLNQRYDNLTKQVENRSADLQKAKSSYSSYRSDYDDLNSWLSTLPNYEPKETDDLQEIDHKLKNQRRLLTDIANKEPELQKVSNNAKQYQEAVKDYELGSETFKSLLNLDDAQNGYSFKKPKIQSPAAKVANEESALVAKFTEVNAANKQKLQNLEFAQKLLNQQPQIEVMQQQQHVQSIHAETPGQETWRVNQQLADEKLRRSHLEKEIKVTRDQIVLLERKKPEEIVVKRQSVKQVPDPQLDESLHKVQKELADEQRQSKALQVELESLQCKYHLLENEKQEGAQEYVVKEVTRIAKDRDQEEEVLRLKEELEEIRRHKMTREHDITILLKQISILTEEKNKEQEKITEKELVKVQNDPQLEAEFRRLQDRKKRESELREEQEEDFRLLQEKVRQLEKEKAKAEEKIVVKEVLKVEKDLNLERESTDLRSQYEDELAKTRHHQRQITELKMRTEHLQEEKAKTVIQEKVRDIVRPDPKAESEMANLRLELVEHQRRYVDAEQQLKHLQDELEALRNKGPQIEIKERVKEVIKYKMDPETEKNLENLREDIVDRTQEIERNEVEISQLKDEINIWKNTKPQVEVKEVFKEVLEYREDPNTKEEIKSLKQKLAEEQKRHMELEREKADTETKINFKEKDLAQVREKVVQEEVVKFEEDPAVKAECNTFSQSIADEQKQIRKLREDLRTLEQRKNELELQLKELEQEKNDRKEAEQEIQRLKIRLHELELLETQNKEKVTVKQKVVLQQDPQQEKEHSMVKLQLEDERQKREDLEKELNVLKNKYLTLDKMDNKEKVVFTEKVEIVKNPETEKEIQRLKSNLADETKHKNELDQELYQLNSKLSELELANSRAEKELENLKSESRKLEMEKQNLLRESQDLKYRISSTVDDSIDVRGQTVVDGSSNLEYRISCLEKELEDLKKKSKEKDEEITELQKRLTSFKSKREQKENHLRRSIVVIDPDTGKEMTPEEAHKLGLIDWKMLVNLKSQECDWEEITVKGPDGDSSVLHDRKSGKKFSIDEALKSGKITRDQLHKYNNKELSIQEFGVMVSGRK
uniref:Periplakin n=1 Tax=Latimeria chalumnae TaxID=7897 RepID=H2ZY21_LATCH